MKRLPAIRRKQSAVTKGFSLIEVLISAVILTIGLLTILALFAKGLAATQFAQQDLVAKQKAREQLEAIYAARNDARVTWSSIQNVPAGIYLTGLNPLYAVTDQSTDIMGTTFNAGAPNYDFYVSRTGTTGAFQLIALNPPNWQRQVTILNTTDPNLRQVTVTVQVTTPGIGARSYSVVGYISPAQ